MFSNPKRVVLAPGKAVPRVIISQTDEAYVEAEIADCTRRMDNSIPDTI